MSALVWKTHLVSHSILDNASQNSLYLNVHSQNRLTALRIPYESPNWKPIASTPKIQIMSRMPSKFAYSIAQFGLPSVLLRSSEFSSLERPNVRVLKFTFIGVSKPELERIAAGMLLNQPILMGFL